MNYPVNTSIQLRAVLRALRHSHDLSQAEVGRLLGVSQKRVARIESVPGVTSFDQIARLVATFGARLAIEVADTPTDVGKASGRKAAATRVRGNW